jgi:hypothetical protein
MKKEKTSRNNNNISHTGITNLEVEEGVEVAIEEDTIITIIKAIIKIKDTKITIITTRIITRKKIIINQIIIITSIKKIIIKDNKVILIDTRITKMSLSNISKSLNIKSKIIRKIITIREDIINLIKIMEDIIITRMIIMNKILKKNSGFIIVPKNRKIINNNKIGDQIITINKATIRNEKN